MFTGPQGRDVLSIIGAIVGDYFGGSTGALGDHRRRLDLLFDFPPAWAAISASAFGSLSYVGVSTRRATVGAC